MTERVNWIESLFRWEAERPNTPWLFQPIDGQWRSYTWAEAADQVRRMASALKSLDYPPGSRICISGRNTAHWVMADLAIMLAGHIPVGLYPKQKSEITRYILEHTEARAVFVGPELDVATLLAAVPDSVLKIGLPYPGVPATDVNWADLVAAHPRQQEYAPPPPEALLTIVYTSGTSGMPKGVMLTYGNVDFCSRQFLLHVVRPQPNERLLSYLPLAHLLERLLCEGTGLVIGGEIHFLERIEDFQATLVRVAPTRFAGVPQVYTRMRAGVLGRIPQERLDRLLSLPLVGRLVRRRIRREIGLDHSLMSIVGSAPTPREIIEWFDTLGIEICQGYGPSESTAYVSCSVHGANRHGATGKILPGAEVRISEEGEILCRHPGLMAGYYREPELTREAFTQDGYLKTGDKGFFDDDGYLYISGRLKEIFKTAKGKYVAPAPIESQISLLTFVENCCVVGSGLSQPLAMVTLSTGEAFGNSDERERLSALLQAHMLEVNQALEPHACLSSIIVTPDRWTPDNGFITPTLKVKRSAVEERYGAQFQSWAERKGEIVWA